MHILAMKIKKNILIDEEDAKFIEDNNINLSKFVRKKIKELSGRKQEKEPIKQENKI